jgi:serine/threonine protein kinase/tetratricopeptide (TPR) repeat protein
MSTLSPDRWKAVSPYLDKALTLGADERAAWLGSIEQSDPSLAADLKTLLEEHRIVAGRGFMEQGPTPMLIEPPLQGQNLGAYTLVSPIGSGGMGSVWLAERSDGRFDRRVAVKFLSFALMDHGGQERFKREGKLLARLDHPHIAELVDAGVSATGQPYLVLEHVSGEPIDRYCESRGLDVEARLRLFLDVLAAVAHAHANLIVHRDLKPSNVLVSIEGQVKLLDFGIAKLLEEDAQAGMATELTREGGGAMTPEYAAPEQITGGPVTIATDVYALGVLLYLLLTGQHPAGPGPHSAADLVKAIVDTEPLRPSEAAENPRLRRALRGDLDTIIGKALKKRPVERYASATAYGDDLRRYLRHEPIVARPDSIAYRGAKFIRRNRWPIAAVGLVVTALSAGLYVTNRARMTAESRFSQLRRLSVSVFDLDQTIRNLSGGSEARRALVAAALGYLEGLASEVGGDADLAQELADGYWRLAQIQGVPIDLNLGDFAAAEESLEKADRFVEMVLRARPLDRRALERSALICHDRMILAQSQRRNSEARTYALKAVERADLLLGRGNPSEREYESAGTVFGNAALAFLNMHAYEEGTRLSRRSVDLARQRPGHERDVGLGLSVLANALRAQGDLEGALQAIREARQDIEKAGVTDATVLMTDTYQLCLREGLILGEDGGVSLNRPDEAIASLRAALEITENGARRDPSDFTSRGRLATAGRELGDILRWRDPREALSVYDLAYQRLGEVKGNLKTRRDQARLLASSSYALRRLQRGAEAQQRIDSALALLRETKDYPAEGINLDSEVYTVLLAVADHQAENGRPEEAIKIYEELVEKVKASERDPKSDLPYANGLALLHRSLAELYRRTGASEDAEHLEAARAALWKHWKEKLPNNAFVLRQLQPPA